MTEKQPVWDQFYQIYDKLDQGSLDKRIPSQKMVAIIRDDQPHVPGGVLGPYPQSIQQHMGTSPGPSPAQGAMGGDTKK